MRTLALPPSRAVGAIKDRIKDAILDGEIENNREQAWTLMLKIAREKGIEIVKP
jgi:poly(A) polymerase